MTAVQVKPRRPPPASRVPERTVLDDTPAAYWIVGTLLVLAPAFCSNFVLLQILGWAMILGMIALSLMFLAGYGGMVSLAQMTIAGFAGYMSSQFSASNGLPGGIGLNWPWWLSVPAALMISPWSFGAIIGALAVRTAGIYTIMITLAIAAAFFYFVQSELRDLQRPYRHQQPAFRPRSFWASIGTAPIPFVLSDPELWRQPSCAGSRCSYIVARSPFRAGAPGHPGQRRVGWQRLGSM